MARKKGLVLETHHDGAVVLFPGGHYRRVKNHGELLPGEVYQEKAITVLHLATAALLVLFFTAVVMDFFTVQTYASIGDVELGLNRWQRVITIHNQAPDFTVATDDLRGKSVEDALVVILAGKVEAEQTVSQVAIQVKGKDNSPASQAAVDKIELALQEKLPKSNRLKNLQVRDNPGQGLVVVYPPPREEIKGTGPEPDGNQEEVKPAKGNPSPGFGQTRENNGQGKKNDSRTVPPEKNKARQETIPGIMPLSDDPIQTPMREEYQPQPAAGNKTDLAPTGKDNRGSQSEPADKVMTGKKENQEDQTSKEDKGKSEKGKDKDKETAGQVVPKEQGQPGPQEYPGQDRNANSCKGQGGPEKH